MANLTTKITHIISGDVVSKGFAFLATIYLTRVLGTEGFGMITIALSYLGYAVFFSDFGLGTIGSREVAKSKGKRIFSPFEILLARISMASIVFILFWFLLPSFISDALQLRITKSFLFAVFAHGFLLEWYFTGIQKYSISAISKSITTGIYTFGAFLLVKTIGDIQHLPLIFIAGFFIPIIMLLILAIRDNAFDFSVRATVFPKLIKASSSVGSGLLFAQIIQLLPPIVIGLFLSTADAGLYGAAIRLIIIGMLIDRLFVQLLIPNLAKQWSEDKERAKINIEHTSRVLLSVGALVSVFIASGAEDFSIWLFGSEFAEAATIAVALSLFLFFTFQNSLFSHGLVSIGKDTQFFKATAFGGTFSILLIIGASYYFNSIIVGLAIATGEFVIGAMCYFWFKQSLSFNYISPLIRTLIAGLITYFSVSLIEISPVYQAFLSAIILLGLLLAARVLRFSDINWTKAVLIK